MLCRAHVVGMTFAMIEDEPLDPTHVGLFGFVGVPFAANDLTDLVEKSRLLGLGGVHGT